MNDLTIAESVAIDEIRSRIFTIRGVQVILAPDLADMYHVETRIFNQAVKRNLKRFPGNFRFQLTKEELEEVITKCDNPDRLRFSPQLPFAFTEQGIAMLSGVLNSDIAIQVNIRIMNTFVAMRRALATVTPLLARIEATDRRQIADQLRNDANQARNEERFKLILDAMRDKTFPPQKVFFDGQIYDAFEQMKKFVRMAKTELIVIDPYFDDSVLPLIAQKRTGVSVLVVKNLRDGWRVRIVGPDQENHTAELKSLCAGLGISQDFDFVGPKYGDELQHEYANADIFVLPTHSENFGSVVIEALAHCVPVITTKGTPWHELEGYTNSQLTTHNSQLKSGWWIDIGVPPLVAALKDAMSLSDAERREMGERGRRLVEEKYTWDAVVKKVVEGYERVVSR